MKSKATYSQYPASKLQVMIKGRNPHLHHSPSSASSHTQASFQSHHNSPNTASRTSTSIPILHPAAKRSPIKRINRKKIPTDLRFGKQQACVVPRPIGWISTVAPSSSSPASDSTTSDQNDPPANLAPYSQFQNLTFDPPYVMFSANQTPTNQRKDSVINAEATEVFCWQLATWALRDAVNVTSEQFEYGVDEFEKAGLTKTWSRGLKTRVPMVEESPVRFECEYHSTVRLEGNPPMGSVDVVIGKVVGVHIKEEVLTDGKVDVRKTMPIARCGYYEYAVIRETFEMAMPGAEIMRSGLEGNARKNKEYGEKKQVDEGGSPRLVAKE